MLEYMPMRRLDLRASLNTRDLGGYPCEQGATRWGVFLRSDHFRGTLSDRDADYLRRYGLTTVLDLRSDGERKARPSVLEQIEGVTGHHVSMSDRLHAVNFEGDLPGSMSGLYIWLLDDSQQEIAECMRILADAPGAALFHCAVGKDRTGVIAMLLLKLAGVSEADIVADYAVTEIYIRELFDDPPPMEGGQKVPEVAVRSLPESMWRALHHLRHTYGTVEKYLLGIGVDEAHLEALRRKFVCFSGEK